MWAWLPFTQFLQSEHSQVLAFHAEYQVTSKHERRRAWAIVELGQPLVPDEDVEVPWRALAAADDGAGKAAKDGNGPPHGEMLETTRGRFITMPEHMSWYSCLFFSWNGLPLQLPLPAKQPYCRLMD